MFHARINGESTATLPFADPGLSGPRTRSGRLGPGSPGRPKGSRTWASQAAEALLQGETKAISRKAVGLALAGDTTALRPCLERICPPRKDTPAQFALPPMSSATDAVQEAVAIPAFAATQGFTLAEGTQMTSRVEGFRRTCETGELARRLTGFEEDVRRAAACPPARRAPRGAAFQPGRSNWPEGARRK